MEYPPTIYVHQNYRNCYKLNENTRTCHTIDLEAFLCASDVLLRTTPYNPFTQVGYGEGKGKGKGKGNGNGSGMEREHHGYIYVYIHIHTKTKELLYD